MLCLIIIRSIGLGGVFVLFDRSNDIGINSDVIIDVARIQKQYVISVAVKLVGPTLTYEVVFEYVELYKDFVPLLQVMALYVIVCVPVVAEKLLSFRNDSVPLPLAPAVPEFATTVPFSTSNVYLMIASGGRYPIEISPGFVQ